MNNAKLRVVFDSNVYVAAGLRPGGHADIWLDIATLPNSGLTLCVSQPILDEVRRKLISLGVLPGDVDGLAERIGRCSVFVVPKEQIKDSVHDQDDKAILECAVAARAHLIISADSDLLRLNPFRGIGIAHPRELKRIFAQDFQRHSRAA